jgi:hypothetical protein
MDSVSVLLGRRPDTVSWRDTDVLFVQWEIWNMGKEAGHSDIGMQ